MPDNEVPVTPPETPPADTGPTRDDLAKIALQAQADLRESREQARLEREQRNAPQPRQIVDPLKNYTENDLLMSPEERRKALSDAMMLRARAESERSRVEMEGRFAQERSNMETKFAIDTISSQRPDLMDPKNASNFAAAVTKARYEADAAGVTLSPMQLSQKAIQYHDQMFGVKPSQRPPFVEGMSRPDLTPGQVPQDVVTPQTILEKQYGQKKGKIRPMYDVNDVDQVNALNMEYIHRKNTPLFKKGAQSNLGAVLATLEE